MKGYTHLISVNGWLVIRAQKYLEKLMVRKKRRLQGGEKGGR